MYLVFSDTHFTTKVDKRRLEFLKKLILSVDRVVINGDLWDGLFITFDDFVKSGWSELFPLMKSKNAVYIHGNHDKKEFCDDRVNLFSIKQATYYDIRINDKVYYLSHGDDMNPSFTRITKKAVRFVPKFVFKAHYLAERALLNYFGYRYTNLIHKRFNKEIKETFPQIIGSESIYVCGHTHHVEEDLDNAYINTGYFDFGDANYLLINDDGSHSLMREHY